MYTTDNRPLTQNLHYISSTGVAYTAIVGYVGLQKFLIDVYPSKSEADELDTLERWVVINDE